MQGLRGSHHPGVSQRSWGLRPKPQTPLGVGLGVLRGSGSVLRADQAPRPHLGPRRSQAVCGRWEEEVTIVGDIFFLFFSFCFASLLCFAFLRHLFLFWCPLCFVRVSIQNAAFPARLLPMNKCVTLRVLWLSYGLFFCQVPAFPTLAQDTTMAVAKQLERELPWRKHRGRDHLVIE